MNICGACGSKVHPGSYHYCVTPEPPTHGYTAADLVAAKLRGLERASMLIFRAICKEPPERRMVGLLYPAVQLERRYRRYCDHVLRKADQ